jgi:hypothetical protein
MLSVPANKPSRDQIKAWFEDKYRAWRNQQTTRQDGVVHFATFLGVPRDSLNSYLTKGSRPQGTYKDKIGEKYPDLYDILGETPPDSAIRLVQRLMQGMSPERKEKLARLAQEMAENPATSKRAKRKREPKPGTRTS